MVKLNKKSYRREVKQKENTMDWMENAVTEFKEKLAKEQKQRLDRTEKKDTKGNTMERGKKRREKERSGGIRSATKRNYN